MTSAPAAGGGGAGVLAPAPCTPEEFDIFWEKVEELELQDVLQCIGDDLSGAGGCLTQAEWPELRRQGSVGNNNRWRGAILGLSVWLCVSSVYDS